MDIEEFREYCISLADVVEKTPFGKFARRYESILVFYVCDHIFCLTDIDDFSSVTLKSTPDEIEELRQSYASAVRPRNFSERHWVQINLNGDIPDSLVYRLVKRSYDIVKAKYTPKTKRT